MYSSRSRAGLALIARAHFSGAEADRMAIWRAAWPRGMVHDAALAHARRIVSNAEEILRDLVMSSPIMRADLEAQLESDVAAQTRSYASLAFRTRVADYLPDYYDAGR